MQRPDARRPAPLQIDRIVSEREEEESVIKDLSDFLNKKQIIGCIDPDDLEDMGSLGQGNGGVVNKVRHKPTNQILARKIIRVEVNPAERNQIMKELEVLNECNSEFIVGYFGASCLSGQIYIYMEYMDGRSLDSILSKTKRIPEDILGKITTSVVQGLIYLKDHHNLMHRDIKPSNILVNSRGHIKLCDFGVSGHLTESIAQTFVGTRQYMSPERLMGSSYKVQGDIWSLGLSLVELALGMYPIPQHDPMKMYEGEPSPEAGSMSVFSQMECIINQPPPTVPGPPIFSADFKDFVDRCLKKLLEERFDLRTIVQHPFVINSEESQVDVAHWVTQVYSS